MGRKNPKNGPLNVHCKGNESEFLWVKPDDVSIENSFFFILCFISTSTVLNINLFKSFCFVSLKTC